MEGIREQVLDVLRDDFRRHGNDSMLVEYLRGKEEGDLRVCAGNMAIADLQQAVITAILRSPKIAMAEIAPVIGAESVPDALSAIRSNRDVRKKLVAYKDRSLHPLTESKLETLLTIALKTMPRPSKSLSLMMERESCNGSAEQLNELQERIDRELNAEAGQWLRDRGFPLMEREDSSLRVWDIPIELASIVLARHKEISLHDDEYDAMQAWALKEALSKAGFPEAVVPIRIDVLTGSGLYLRSSAGAIAFMVRFLGENPVQLGNPSCPDIIEEEYFAWLEGSWKHKRFGVFHEMNRMSGRVVPNVPERYRLFFPARGEKGSIEDAVGEERKWMEERAAARRIRTGA